MKVCLDTSAYSMLMRGCDRLTQCIENSDRVFVPVPVIGELQAGFRLGQRIEKNMAELASFLSLPAVDVVDVTRDVADRYSLLVKTLSDQGTPIPTNDIWIAAVALETGSLLVSYDTHFDQIPGLVRLAP